MILGQLLHSRKFFLQLRIGKDENLPTLSTNETCAPLQDIEIENIHEDYEPSVHLERPTISYLICFNSPAVNDENKDFNFCEEYQQELIYELVRAETLIEDHPQWQYCQISSQIVLESANVNFRTHEDETRVINTAPIFCRKRLFYAEKNQPTIVRQNSDFNNCRKVKNDKFYHQNIDMIYNDLIKKYDNDAIARNSFYDFELIDDDLPDLEFITNYDDKSNFMQGMMQNQKKNLSEKTFENVDVANNKEEGKL